MPISASHSEATRRAVARARRGGSSAWSQARWPPASSSSWRVKTRLTGPSRAARQLRRQDPLGAGLDLAAEAAADEVGDHAHPARGQAEARGELARGRRRCPASRTRPSARRPASRRPRRAARAALWMWNCVATSSSTRTSPDSKASGSPRTDSVGSSVKRCARRPGLEVDLERQRVDLRAPAARARRAPGRASRRRRPRSARRRTPGFALSGEGPSPICLVGADHRAHAGRARAPPRGRAARRCRWRPASAAPPRAASAAAGRRR